MNNQKQNRPSRIAEVLLRLLLPERERQDLLGDYAEYYQEMADSKGQFIAALWYCMQIINLIPRSIWNSITWSLVMIRNYLKIAFRNFYKQKLYSTINIVCLVLGMSCFMLIMLYVIYELSFDRYHEKANRIYRIARSSDTDYMGRKGRALTPPPLAPPPR